jgi:hypothetical protein
MKFRRTGLAISVSLALAACGGGGGGGSTTLSPFVRASVPFHAPVRIDSVLPTDANTYVYNSSALISQDLRGNGIQSLILAGRMAPNGGTYHDYHMQIWDWQNGNLINATASWFAGDDNKITGTEPSVRFADFDRDGKIDMYVAPHTDTNVFGPGIVYFNEGHRFTRRNILLDDVPGHGSAVFDLNGDGYTDIVTMGLRFTFGGPGRNFTTYWGRGDYPGGGADVAAADFLGNGTSTLILTDMNSNQVGNNRLYTWNMGADGVYITQIGTLPTPRFLLPKWAGYGFAGSHDTRVLAFDFDNSGLSDAVIFSRPWITAGQWPAYSEIQFNRNLGGGVFQDVTDAVLIGYDNTLPAAYHPVLTDVNNDGLIDIVLGGTGWGNNRGAQVLLHTQDHRYVASYADILEAFADQAFDLERALHNTAGFGANGIAFVRGPDNVMYLATAVSYEDSSGRHQKAIYLSRLGDMAPSAQATADMIQQVWPWMSPAQVNSVLASTAGNFVNGVAVIDLRRIWSPVGHLGLLVNGKRQVLAGHVSVPGLDSKSISSITALDELGRDFRVDLSVMRQHTPNLTVDHILSSVDPQQNWSSRMVGDATRQNLGLSLTGRTADRFASSVSTRRMGITQDWDINLGIARMPGSPWMSFSGVFGTIQDSIMVDTTLGRHWSNGAFVQGSVMQTTTNFQTGLIDRITPLWSASAMAGWQDQAWSLYGGVQPTIVAGSMSMTLPTSVDRQGKVQYTRYSTNIRNDAVAFAGFQRRWRFQDQSWSLSGALNDHGSYRMQLDYRKDF